MLSSVCALSSSSMSSRGSDSASDVSSSSSSVSRVLAGRFAGRLNAKAAGWEVVVKGAATGSAEATPGPGAVPAGTSSGSWSVVEGTVANGWVPTGSVAERCGLDSLLPFCPGCSTAVVETAEDVYGSTVSQTANRQPACCNRPTDLANKRGNCTLSKALVDGMESKG